MATYVLNLRDIDHGKLSAIDGKCVNLNELSRLEGIIVPDGFCLIAEAYREAIPDNIRLNNLPVQLF